MPGHVPGPLGFAAFGGVKFAGYTMAGSVLRRVYPATNAGALTIAAARTGLGLAVGLSHIAFWAAVQSHWSFDNRTFFFFFWPGLLILRLLIWIAIIWFFCDRKWEGGKTVIYAIVGTAFSFLLDVVGIALALVTPGQLPFC